VFLTTTPTPAIYPLSLHDALPIFGGTRFYERKEVKDVLAYLRLAQNPSDTISLARVINTPTRGIGDKTVNEVQRWSERSGLSLRSEEHTSELQSRFDLVCRLLLEK